MISAHAEVNKVDKLKQSALMVAAAKGYLSIVQLLIDTGEANIHWRDSKGRFPLLAAACNGKAQTAEFLINRGADVHQRDDDGWTPLIGAVNYSQTSVIHCLLNNGADISAVDEQLYSPLHHAAMNCQLPIVKLLVDAGATSEIKGELDTVKSPLALAEERSKLDIVEYLTPLIKKTKGAMRNGFFYSHVDSALKTLVMKKGDIRMHMLLDLYKNAEKEMEVRLDSKSPFNFISEFLDAATAYEDILKQATMFYCHRLFSLLY